MTTRAEELRWFEENAPTWGWKWATTYADFAPHSYVIKDKQLDPETYERAFRVTMMCGRPRKYWSKVNIELECPTLVMAQGPKKSKKYPRQIVTGNKFWPMSHQRSVSKAYNTAPLGMSYGVQDAPDSTTSKDDPADFHAIDWDDRLIANPRDPQIKSMLWKEFVGTRDVSVLDLSARGGEVLDMSIATKRSRYRAVDPSQGMLNVLLYRHQWVRDVVPLSLGEYFDRVDTHDPRNVFDLAIAANGSASFLSPEAIDQVSMHGRRWCLMFCEEGATDDGLLDLPSTAEEAYDAARRLPNSREFVLGGFRMVTGAV